MVPVLKGSGLLLTHRTSATWIFEDGVGKNNKRDYQKIGNPFYISNNSQENGGGGGSRTRVRKHSTWASTCLSRSLSVSHRGPSGRGPLRLILIRVSRLSHQALTVAIPLVDALSRSAGVTWKDGSLSSYGVVIIVCDYMFSRRFTSRQESSTCSQCFFAPVEPVSPPFSQRTLPPKAVAHPMMIMKCGSRL